METKGQFVTFLEKEIKVKAGNGKKVKNGGFAIKKHLHFYFKGKFCFSPYMDEQLM